MSSRADVEQADRGSTPPRASLADGRPVDGCPSAALLDEIGRCAVPTRQAYTDGVLIVTYGIAARLAPADPLSALTKSLTAYAMMAGTLQLSRALADPRLADELLEQGIHNTLALLDVEHAHAGVSS